MEQNNSLLDPSRSLDRRAFIKVSSLLGLGAVSSLLIPVGAEAVKFDRKHFKVSSTRLAMGTLVSMTLIHESRDQAQEAMGRAFEEMDRLARLLNRHDRTTAVALLNREGRLKDAPPELCNVVSRALQHHKLSGGAFDITVKPLVDLFRERIRKGQPPDVSGPAIRKALALVDAGAVHMQGAEIRFDCPGMGLTLDGIAKGFIVDRASALLSREGVQHHLVNAGGDIRTRGKRLDGAPWAVAIEDPEKRGEYPDVLRMGDGAVATSGNYEVYFDREKMVHHIVDPDSGLSPRLGTSVSIRAQRAVDADALATGVFVMKPAAGMRLVESLPDCSAMIIARNGKQWTSRGWKRGAR